MTMTLTNANDLDVPGICFLCRGEVPGNDSRIHAHDCIENMTSEADGDVMLISAWCENRFLRRVWLGCCDHQSRFIVREQLDLAGKPTAVDWELENILVRAAERYIREPMEDFLDRGSELEYQYDPAHTTRIQLGCSGFMSVPFDELRDRLSTSCLEGALATGDFVVIGRNDPPEKCETCDDIAYWRYHRDPDHSEIVKDGVAVSDPPYFCDQCWPSQEKTLVILENSPRVGVHCYDAAHNEPEDDPGDE